PSSRRETYLWMGTPSVQSLDDAWCCARHAHEGARSCGENTRSNQQDDAQCDRYHDLRHHGDCPPFKAPSSVIERSYGRLRVPSHFLKKRSAKYTIRPRTDLRE